MKGKWKSGGCLKQSLLGVSCGWGGVGVRYGSSSPSVRRSRGPPTPASCLYQVKCTSPSGNIFCQKWGETSQGPGSSLPAYVDGTGIKKENRKVSRKEDKNPLQHFK